MKVNYHTHTARCKHAGGTDEEYIQAALDAHMDVLGFSDHAPFPDHDFGLRMDYSELNEYLDSLTLYRQRYADSLQIVRGLEIEYLPQYHTYYEKLLADNRLDYLLLGEHFFMDEQGALQNIYAATSTELYCTYASNIIAGMNTGYFRILAHPDLMFIGNFAWDDHCSRATDLLLNAAAAHDWILEYNANGLRRGIQTFPDGNRPPYPHPRFWNEVAKTNIRVVVGADAHGPQQVWDETMQAAIAQVQKQGFNIAVPPERSMS